MAQTTSAHEADPVINVIEPDMPGNGRGPAAPNGHHDRPGSAAMDAVSSRRRREFDAARARLRDRAIRDDTVTPQQADTGSSKAATTEADRVRRPLDQPPERVRKRYLRAGNQYFLKDAPYQMAFEDLGPYLVTEHNRPDVVESMIDMVQAKAWRRIRVSGHESFRSEAWLQGMLLGIEVRGYEPKAADVARLADARRVRMDNRIEVASEVGTTVTTGAPGRGDDLSIASSLPRRDAVSAVNETSPSASVRASASEPLVPGVTGHVSNDEADAPRRYDGELREHGGAPYQHNPARGDSYYVVFRDEAGVDQVVWGVDLERAVREAGAEIGQQVTLQNLGKRLVTVRVPILNEEGTVVGEGEKDVYRNTWQVEIAQRDRIAAASPSHTDGPASGDSRSADSHAEPVSAGEAQISRDESYSESDRALHLAVLMAAMREQGFSERSVARVQQRAERMLVAFQREGIPVPKPKVFDPTAPSSRDRRRRSAPERTPAREIDRTPVEPSSLSPSR
jgi:hypothetical protein